MRAGKNSSARILAAAAMVLALAGCGFQLRGAAALPFETIYLPDADRGVALELKRNILNGTNARVLDDAKQAQVALQFVSETRLKDILTLTGTGRVGEFRLGYRVTYRVSDRQGREFVPLTTLLLNRDVTYSDTAILAKQEEEEILYRDMQSDAVRQIVRRLSSAQAPR